MSLSKVHKALTDDSPMLVHCSDGVGRSGTFCLVDMSIRRVAKGEVFPRVSCVHDVVEAHCYIDDIGRIDLEQIHNRISNK